MNSDRRTKNISPLSLDEYRFKLNQFLQDKMTATELLTEEKRCDTGLKEAIVALAQRNVKQGKA